MKEEHEKIELRSEEVQEILGTPPSVVVRWGTFVILFSVIMLFFLSWWIQYPEVVNVSTTLVTDQAPVEVVAHTDGYIEKLLVGNEEAIERGKVLAVVQNTANFEDVLSLDSFVNSLQFLDKNGFRQLVIPYGLQLGDLQVPFDQFLKTYEQFLFSTKDNFGQQSKSRIVEQIKSHQKAIITQQAELKLNQQHYAQARKNIKKLQTQFSNKEATYEQLVEMSEKIKKLQARIASIHTAIAHTESQIVALKNDRVNQDRNFSTHTHQNFLQLKESIHELQQSIQEWKKTYLLTAQTDGELSYHSFLREKQHFSKGEPVFDILSANKDSLLALAFISPYDKGKVKIGQQVMIKLAAYPFQEYGMVLGVVESIGKLPRENRYPITIALPKALKTTTGKTLSFDQGMLGIAEIITDKKRLYQKIIENFSQ